MSALVALGDSSASPRGDDADRVEQVGRLDALAEEAAGPAAQGLEDVLVGLEGGQDQHPYAGEVVVGGDGPGGGEAVHVGHADVHQDDVGAGARGPARPPPARSSPRRRPRGRAAVWMSMRNPARMRAWSSASRTRMVIRRPPSAAVAAPCRPVQVGSAAAARRGGSVPSGSRAGVQAAADARGRVRACRSARVRCPRPRRTGGCVRRCGSGCAARPGR